MSSRPNDPIRTCAPWRRSLLALVAGGLAAAVAGAAAAQAGSDDCAAPTPIQGGGLFDFDLSAATTSGQGYLGNCLGDATGFASNDVWFCWTADCDGMVTISTCGYTQVDTVVAIYPESLVCQCPGDLSPLCCNDDACDKQSEVSCEVVCGRRYLIQVGAKAGSFLGAGQVQIDCQGEPCGQGGGGGGGGGNGGPGGGIECAPCCGARPAIADSSALSFNPGAVAAATGYPVLGDDVVVRLLDLGNQGSAPIGTLTSWSTGRWNHPDWTLAGLGTVFGVVIDGGGDVFVTNTPVYGVNAAGSFGGFGSVYRLDGATGAPQEFIRLPSQPNPALNGVQSGLGQVDYSCEHDRYYVTNFEDGRIYAIDASGAVTSTFDHATGVATGALPAGGLAEPGDAPGAVPLGERVFAVKAASGRVAYGLWVEDIGNANPARNNEVWSVAVDANGDFVGGTATLEVSLPQDTVDVTNPPADIAFDGNCCMLVAERGMSALNQTTPHVGRVLKFCRDDAGVWQPAPETFDIGSAGANNSSGGVDVEGLPNDRVWSVGDAIEIDWTAPFNHIYGLVGFPSTGGDRDNSILLDFDGDLDNQQKGMLGSIDLDCVDGAPASPCEFATLDIDCVPSADGAFTFLWTVEITNNSPHDANILVLGDPAFAPNNVVLLNPPLASGSSTSIDIPIVGQAPGSAFCFTATLAASFKNECCTEEICIGLPECTCFDADVETRDLAGNGAFEFELDLVNLEPYVAEWLSVAVAPGYAATVSPSLLDIAPGLPFGASATLGPVQVSTALPPGSQIVVIVGIHSQSFHPCCFRELVLTVPAQQGVSQPGDVNGDGVVDAQDVAMLLGSWGDGGPTDLDDDGTTGAQDLAILLANWG